MTLDASGRLLVGTTSTYDFNGQANLVVTGTSNNSTLTIASTTDGYIAFADGTSGTDRYAGMINYNHPSNYMVFRTAATEQARIDASGNLLIGTTTNTNTSKLVVNGTISQTVGGTQYLVVDQSDIGTAPNEIPLNQYLGSLAYQNGDAYFNTGMTVGFRNRIINGDMHIAQRATSVSAFSGGGYQTLDRWNLFQNLGAMNIAQSSTAPTGFSNSMQFTVSTAASQTSSSTSIVTPNQSIEGFNFDDMAWGTSNAKPVTVSVWVYSSLVGQYAIWIRNSAADRFYATPFTITIANTWQQVTATIAGDTSGTWIGATNGIGATVGICLAAGSSRVGAGNTWSGSSFYGVTGQVDWQATSSNTFYFTGFQLEKGNIATSFDVRPYGTELQLCQRYYYKNLTSSDGLQRFQIDTYVTTGIYPCVSIPHPVPMRTTPTKTKIGAWFGSGINPATVTLGGNELLINIQADANAVATRGYLFPEANQGWSASAEL
jgi:hypothetical protein